MSATDPGVAAEPDDRRVTSFARNSVFGTIAALTNAFSSLFASIILAHTLGVARTGVVAFALWAVMVAETVGHLGIPSTLSRYIPELTATGRAAEAQRLTWLLLRWLLAGCASVLVAFGALAAWSWDWGATPDHAVPWGLVGVTAAVQALGQFTYGYLGGHQRFDRMVLIIMVSVFIQLTSIVWGSLHFGVAGALAGYCAGSAIPAVLCLRHLHAVGRPSRATHQRVRRFAFYNWGSSLLAIFVWSRAEVFFLERSSGSVAVGLFAVAVTLANIAAQGPTLLTAALLPHFAESFGRGAIAEIQETCAAAMRLLAFLAFPASFGLAALLPSLVPLFYGSAFEGAVPAATVLLVPAAITAITSVGGRVVTAMDRSDYQFMVGATSAAMMIVAGFTVIPAFGVMGAAWARGGIQLITIGIGIWLIVTKLRIRLPLRALAKLFVAAALCGLAARVCLLTVGGTAALPVGIIAGTLTYAAAVRMLCALPARDCDRIRRVCRPLPTSFRNILEVVFRLLGVTDEARGGLLSRIGVALPARLLGWARLRRLW